MVSSPGKLLIAGDFNFHIDDKTDTRATKFVDLLNCFNLSILNVMNPTHRNNHVLDLLISRSDELFTKNIVVHDPVLSDHYAVHCNLSFNKPRPFKQVISYRKLHSINIDNFKRDVLNSSLIKSPAENLSELCQQYDNHAPSLTRTITIRPNAPWYNDDIKINKTKRRNLERRWRRSGLTVDRQSYTNQCDLVKKLISEAKMTYYSNLIVNAGTDNNALFRSIDRLLHRTPDKCLPSSPSPTILANKFSAFFENKIMTIKNKLPHCDAAVSNTFDHFDSPTINCKLDSFSHTTTEQLSNIAGKIISKSCCLDPLPASILVDYSSTLLPVICKIVNLSLDSGFVPPSQKVAVLRSPCLKSHP
jgi:hypothetical protein